MSIKRSSFSIPVWNYGPSTRLSWIFIGIIAFLAIAGPFIANEKPYYCKLEGEKYYPAFSGISEATLSIRHPQHSPVNWKTTDFESIWRAPVAYSHYTVDLKAGRLMSPFEDQSANMSFRHWLGTDLIGRDVLAGMIRGCRISLLIGVGSMLLALFIGVPLGSVAAYYGNSGWKISMVQLIITFISLLLFLYVLWLPLAFNMKWILLAILILIPGILFYFSRHDKGKKYPLPLDKTVMALITLIDSFPGLFIVLILLVILPVKGWLVVMGVIALLRWPVMARYIRAEVFKMKEMNYIRAAQILNLPDSRILAGHVIPFAFRPVMISFIFGIATAILAESSLSFLGIGLPVDELNWGRLLSQARNHFDAWWLVFFPGAAIFFTLLSFYTIGNALQKQYA